MEELTDQLLTLGYFRPSYEIIAHEINMAMKSNLMI